MTRLVQAWNRYWFAPAPLFDLAVARILIVTTQLAIIWFTDSFPVFAGLSTLPDVMYDPLPVLHVLIAPLGWTFRPSLELTHVIWWIVIATGCTSAVGLFTNSSLIVFGLGNIFLKAYAYSFGDFHHPEALMMIALVLLALSPAGRALSIDDLRRRIRNNDSEGRFNAIRLTGETSHFARWPLVTIRWLFALVYASSTLAKFHSGGAEWLNGDTLQWYMLRDALSRDAPIGIWLAQQHGLNVMLSWFTVIFESTFFLLLIFPALAWVYIPAGIGLHTGIYVTMRAPFFQFIGLYAVFVPWAAASHYIGRRQGRKHPNNCLAIYYDGLCPLCIRSMTILHYLDWFGKLRFLDLETEEGRAILNLHPELSLDVLRREIHVLAPDGSITRGFFAFRRIGRVIPTLWPLLLPMHLPLAGRVGPRVYQRVADSRLRVGVCGSDACQRHKPSE